MAKNIKAIKCPQCGSTKQKKLDDEHFECLNCGSNYILDSDDITINHNYNYNNDNTLATPVNKKVLGILFSVAFLVLLGLGLSGVFSRNNSDPVSVVFNKISWQNEAVSQVFTDKNEIIKLFIVGTAGAGKLNTDDKNNKKLYWSVYNVSSGKTEQIEHFNNIGENFSKEDIVLKSLNDGSIYFVFKKAQVYQYNFDLNSLVYLNTDLETTIPQLKSGIASIEVNSSYNCLDMVSNTGTKISYFPSTKLQIPNLENGSAMPNAVLQTKYAVSNSNPNYLIQYQAMQQIGYPAFTRPVFNLIFNHQEEPVNITVSSRDTERALIKNYTIIPTKTRMHKLLLLGNNQDNVAIAYKDNIREGEKYNIQMLDAKGTVKWNLKSGMIFIDHFNSILSSKNELLITANNAFYLIGNDGKIQKKSNLEEIIIEPKD